MAVHIGRALVGAYRGHAGAKAMAVTGWPRLRAQLAALAPACHQAGCAAVAEAAVEAGAMAAALAPVETGRLRASIGTTAAGASATVYANCEYAAAVELGSRGRPARPFLLPAAQAQKSAFPQKARQWVEKALGGK